MNAYELRHADHAHREVVGDLAMICQGITDEHADTLCALRRAQRALREISAAAMSTLQTDLATLAYMASLKDYPRDALASSINAATDHVHSLLRLFKLARVRETLPAVDLLHELSRDMTKARSALAMGLLADPSGPIAQALERVISAQDAA